MDLINFDTDNLFKMYVLGFYESNLNLVNSIKNEIKRRNLDFLKEYEKYIVKTVKKRKIRSVSI